jgi:hypothetical protein
MAHKYRSRYSQYVRRVKGCLIREHDWSPRVANEWAKNNHGYMRTAFGKELIPEEVAKDIETVWECFNA